MSLCRARHCPSNPNKMKLRLTFLIASLALLASAHAQNTPARDARNSSGRPTLLVDITVNGLDYDMLREMSPHFGPDGFNRLLTRGTVIESIDFGSRIDDTAAAAVLATGASPAVNGITGTTLFDQASRRAVSILNDPAQIGNFTDETYSPGGIRVSTLADEVRLDANGLGNVHSIAPSPEQAIIGAGHAGNSATWISDTSGKWATTTYYKDLPSPLASINRRSPLSSRLDTLTWLPAAPQGAMAHLPSYKKIYPFRHSFPRSDTDRYRRFKASAPVNTEVTDLAVDYIKLLGLGRREPIDMLSLAYTLQPYLHGRDGDNRAELIDAYMRLDRDIARLLSAIESPGPGLPSTVVAVAGTPADASTLPDDQKWGVPTGEFSAQRAVSLLKMNLMTIYGNGDWVKGYHNRQFFLNRDLIRERGLNLTEVAHESADFLRKMAGVTYASTLADIIAGGDSRDGIFPPVRNLDADTAGDVFIAVTPGWKITTDDTVAAGGVERMSPATSAAIIMAPSVAPSVIADRVDARAIAPTLSRLLKVRAPAGASVPPLRL